MKLNNDANWIVKIPDQSDIYANDATDYQYTNDMRRQQFDTSLTSINDSLPVIIKHEDVDDVARPSDLNMLYNGNNIKAIDYGRNYIVRLLLILELK